MLIHHSPSVSDYFQVQHWDVFVAECELPVAIFFQSAASMSGLYKCQEIWKWGGCNMCFCVFFLLLNFSQACHSGLRWSDWQKETPKTGLDKHALAIYSNSPTYWFFFTFSLFLILLITDINFVVYHTHKKKLATCDFEHEEQTKH